MAPAQLTTNVHMLRGISATVTPPSEVQKVINDDKGEEHGSGDEEPIFEYIVGWRLHLITLGICLALFMGQMESSIVSTTVLTITNDLGDYVKSSWIFTAYLLTYSGVLIIWAKLSDIFGRKLMLTTAVSVFVVFSGACGASQTLIQLIMFRWVQGIGGCGIYSIGTLLFFELVPSSKWPDYTALVTSVLALALATGPLLGGAIGDNTTWRWAFLLNIPIGAVSLVLLIMFQPRRLPNEPSARAATSHLSGLSTQLLQKVDVLGALLLLGACLLATTALQLAAQGLSFVARQVLPLLIFSGVMWAAFVAWEYFITTKRSIPEPVLPWRFFQSRVILGMILNTYLTGTIFTVCIVQIPQRFMTVNGISPFQAAVRLLPFGCFVPAISTIAAIAMKKRVPPIYILFIGGILEIIGTVGLSKTSVSSEISASQYGFQILTGSGVGCFNAALILLVPFVVESKDLAVGTAAIAQFRILGGVVGLAIVTSVMNRWITSPLLEVLSVKQVQSLLETTDIINSFPDATKLAVRATFGDAFNLQSKVLIGFAVAQIPATILMWKKKLIIVQ